MSGRFYYTNEAPDPKFLGKVCRVFGEGVTVFDIINVLTAEFLGSGIVLMFGCSGYMADDTLQLTSLHRSMYFMFSCIVFGFIYAGVTKMFGHLSQAHFNPAVTMAAIVVGRVTPIMGICYVIFQMAGALSGYGLHRWLTVTVLGKTCCTTPHVRLSQTLAFAHEFFASFILLFLICGVWDRRMEVYADSTPMKIGFGYMVLMVAVGPFTGASMNPVRSFAPAVYEECWGRHWVYWIAPLFAAVLQGLLHRFFFSLYTDEPEVPVTPAVVDQPEGASTEISASSSSSTSLDAEAAPPLSPRRSRVD